MGQRTGNILDKTEILIQELSGEASVRAALLLTLGDMMSPPLRARPYVKSLTEKITAYGRLLVAVQEQPVGFLAFYANDPQTKTAFITLICVDSSTRGCGIGTMLLRACENASQESGMLRLRLEVKKTNTAARTFYKSSGFRDTGEEMPETVFMEKQL